MEYSLIVHGDGGRVTRVRASSAEDAMRQLPPGTADGPLHATFLSVEHVDHEAAVGARTSRGRRRRGSENTGHTRAHPAPGVPR